MTHQQMTQMMFASSIGIRRWKTVTVSQSKRWEAIVEQCRDKWMLFEATNKPLNKVELIFCTKGEDYTWHVAKRA